MANVIAATCGTMDDLGRQLFNCLRQMDAAATTSWPKSQKPVGLCDFGRHARPELKRPQNELEWSKELGRLLARHTNAREKDYPGQEHLPKRNRERCDLVMNISGDLKAWVEIKGAWRDYWGGNNTIYRSYLFHPLLPGLDKSKKHTVPLDLMKLSTLRAPDAHFVAELLVGCEKPSDLMDSDIDTLINLAGLSNWQSLTDSWMSPTVTGQRGRCWYWYRRADGQWTLTLPTVT